MTLMEHNLHAVSSPWIGQAVEVGWSSLRDQGAGRPPHLLRAEFILRIEILNRDHALVESWVESDGASREVFRRRTVRLLLGSDERFVHIDVAADDRPDGQRLAALTLETRTNSPLVHRLVYAQTSLLHDAGFHAGSCDRPRLMNMNVDLSAATA